MAKARILVVEDDRFYIEFYRTILEGEGFTVEVAHSGREAARHLARDGFDLVIADLVLKNSSGLELLAEIKRSSPQQDVIMVTSMQSIRKAVDALKLGASDYLTKPVDREELLLAINTIIERQVVKQEHSKLISENIHFYELQRIEKKNLALLAITEPEKIHDAILDTLIQELNAPGAIIFLRDERSGHFLAAASRGTMELGRDPLELSFPTAGLQQTLEEGRALLQGPGGEMWVPRAGDEGAQLILPLRHRSEVLGAVKLIPRRGERSYGFFDVDLGRHILEAGALALHNARNLSQQAQQGIRGDSPGTYNPVYFRSFCDVQLSVARRYNREAALLLLKLANLSAVSKQFKENQVKQYVDALCGSILELIRETDLLARLEDDLFAVFVPETDFYGGLMLRKRIRARLTRLTYPLDLKWDVMPRFHLGCAACPRDGGTYLALFEAAARRLEEETRSVYRALKVDRQDLWGIVKRLSDPQYLAAVAGAEGVPDLRPISLDEKGFHALARSMLRDLSSFYSSRGLVYLGLGTVDSAAPVFQESEPRESMSISVYALGERGEGLWTMPHITPVFLSDPPLKEHLFILGVTEHFSYALFCRRDGDGGLLRGFHSSDGLLVMELMTGLQEKYLLQRRIG